MDSQGMTMLMNVGRSKGAIALLVFGAMMVASAQSAHAVALSPGATELLPGTTVAAEPQLAGVVQVDDVVPFSFSAYGGTVSGTVQVRVVESSVDNTLDFYWRVFNDAGSAGVIADFRFGDFVTSTYNARHPRFTLTNRMTATLIQLKRTRQQQRKTM